jgi:hypothetical protein
VWQSANGRPNVLRAFSAVNGANCGSAIAKGRKINAARSDSRDAGLKMNLFAEKTAFEPFDQVVCDPGIHLIVTHSQDGAFFDAKQLAKVAALDYGEDLISG